MSDSLPQSLHQEIFRSPKDQRVDLEIVSTDPLTVGVGQLAQLIVPIAQKHGFVPLSSGEQIQPLSGWEELRDQLQFWMARSTSGSVTYLHATAEARGQQMVFRLSDLTTEAVEPAPLEYSQGPASSLASTSLN